MLLSVSICNNCVVGSTVISTTIYTLIRTNVLIKIVLLVVSISKNRVVGSKY